MRIMISVCFDRLSKHTDIMMRIVGFLVACNAAPSPDMMIGVNDEPSRNLFGKNQWFLGKTERFVRPQLEGFLLYTEELDPREKLRLTKLATETKRAYDGWFDVFE